MVILVTIFLVIVYLSVCAIFARSMGLVKCIDPDKAYQKKTKDTFLMAIRTGKVKNIS